MADDATILSVLQSQVADLTGQLQRLTSERDAAKSAHDAVLKERDALKKSAPDTSAQAARIAELEASIRDRNHYDVFADLASKSKAKAKAIHQLWRDAKSMGYDPSTDEVNEKAMGAVLERLKTEVDYAFDQEESASSSTPEAPIRLAPGSSRGAPGAPAPTKHGLTSDQMANPAFMMARAAELRRQMQEKTG